MSSTKGKIKIVIADDHFIFIEGIKALLKDINEVSMAGEAADGEQLLEILKSKDVDVVLMDVNMPKVNGIEATKAIMSNFPKVKVIGLTMHEDSKSISDMMKAGASGYLLKTTGRSELLSAITKVSNGERYLSNEVSMKLIDRMLDNKSEPVQSADVRHPNITKRELEIVKLIAQEMTNEQIAKHLNNSPMTIITHRKNLLRKIGVKNTAGLIRYAVQNGLVD